MQNAYRVTDPRTGAVVESFDSMQWTEAERVIAAADEAHRTWRRLPLEERAASLGSVGKLMRERRHDLAAHASLEMGKPLDSAVGEVGVVADIFEYYAEEGAALLRSEVFTPRSGGTAEILKRPVGVVLGIMPWNYPYYQLARLIAPNLLLGNAVVVKPSPACPRSAAAIERVLLDAGVPPHLYSTLLLDNEDVEKAIADSRVQGVSFTGSERVGAVIGETAGRHLKKVVLELGGSDPFLILDTADPATTARVAYGARMANMGQACNSPKRVIVRDHDYGAIVGELVQQAIKHAADPAMQPLASRAAAEHVHAQIRRAVAQGAKLHTGGALSGVGAFISPAVITDVTLDMDIATEEVFGPVVVVYRADSDEEAIELANQSPYGLGAAVFTSDEQRATDTADQLDVGMVYINCAEDSEPDLPFGGVKLSGHGRELGRLGILEFCNHKLVRRASPA
ncbi:aldehyde dehydrogenase family protein [Modestobacter sp. VKM Ac-2978]|uniref:aldehyde dehydrogenase family protein n=1 Tax=Modestobacter sp. VKM Ac-2978 TaxID=3004132 RepID=UPI0022AB410C|nr:aldehyde dehydrogenase family protein [Modestobacter sp. VKM Ac-2978]MCZ2849857.1 aldehyde dehydrogenase family protein [Modestobacter sp. VKM Ac-2978]